MVQEARRDQRRREVGQSLQEAGQALRDPPAAASTAHRAPSATPRARRVTKMTMQADDERKREAQKFVWDKLTDEWDVLYKGLTGLIVANATGMVACLTLLRDYETATRLKGLGIFIWLFGIGLFCAIWAALAMVWLRPKYLRGEMELAKPKHAWETRGLLILAGLSALCVASAVIIAIGKFGHL
jgi:hypothetical protein